MMTRRNALQWLHWVRLGFILCFFMVEPAGNGADPDLALATQAGVGLILALVVPAWTARTKFKELAGRAGPHLPGRAKRFHRLKHQVLHIALPVMVATGALAGLLAPFAIRALDALLVVIVLYVAFHLWRHVFLEDNAQHLMVPRVLHKYL